MKEIILSKLKEIEQSENIKIIHCVESGSRAWGFASPDSDYDVRFIYIRPLEHYLKLEKTRDVIEWQLDETLDINGWDLQKALRLLHSSNPTLFEWNNSPIIYKTTDEWKKISKIVDKYFNSRSGLYHYLSTAKSNYREYLKGEEVKLKKYFYVLRPILACKWIIDKKTPPPMLFSDLANIYLSGEIKTEVEKLIELKKSTPEIGLGKKVQLINDYIEYNISELETIIPTIEINDNNDWETLDKIFLSLTK